MPTLWVGSRKGLFRFDEGKTGWSMAGPPAFLAAPVTAILDDPRDGTLYVGLAHGHFGCKFHRSLDRGQSWTELAAPAFPPADATDAPAVEMIWCFAAGGPDQPGVIWGGHPARWAVSLCGSGQKLAALRKPLESARTPPLVRRGL